MGMTGVREGFCFQLRQLVIVYLFRLLRIFLLRCNISCFLRAASQGYPLSAFGNLDLRHATYGHGGVRVSAAAVRRAARTHTVELVGASVGCILLSAAHQLQDRRDMSPTVYQWDAMSRNPVVCGQWCGYSWNSLVG
jgi:hypothetical protein